MAVTARAASADPPLPEGEVDRASEAKRGRVRGYQLAGKRGAPPPGLRAGARNPTSPQWGEVKERERHRIGESTRPNCLTSRTWRRPRRRRSRGRICAPIARPPPCGATA